MTVSRQKEHPRLLNRLSWLTTTVTLTTALFSSAVFIGFDYWVDKQNQVEVDVRAMLERDAGTVAAVVLLSLLLSKVASRRVTSEIADPISQLAGKTKEITESTNFAMRLPEYDQAEINQLTESFNDLLAAVEKRDADLVAAQGLFDGFVNHSPSIAYIKDANLNYVFANSNYLRILNRRRKEVLGSNDRTLWSAEIAAALESEDKVALTGSPHQLSSSISSGEMMLSGRLNGHISQHEFPTARGVRLYTLQRFLLLHPDGTPYLGATGIDETDRLAAQRSLKASEERYALAVQGASDGIWDWDLENRQLYLSERCRELLQVRTGSEELRGFDQLSRFVHAQDAANFVRAIGHLIDGQVEQMEIEFRLAQKDEQTEYWLLNRATALRDGKGQATRLAGFISDITGRKLQEAQLRKDAFHDVLTGLPNRALFNDRLSRAWEGVRRNPEQLFGILFLDLDGFKAINDTLGHAVGDDLLREVAARLLQTVRNEDTVARFGGDEFAILVEDLHEVSDTIRVCERILKSLGRPFELGPHVIKSASSIGVALSSPRYNRAEEILADSDTAMYLAKRGGKGTYRIFDEGMDQEAKRKLARENQLKQYFAAGHFRWFFQAIVNRLDERVVGYEALLRLCDDSLGTSPSESAEEFLELSENAGLMMPLLEELLPKAMRHWRELGLLQRELFLQVNLSVRQFQNPGLLQLVENCCKQHQFPAKLLRLDVSESALERDREGGRAIVRDLTNLGCLVGLEHFGSGKSSLHTLCETGFSYYKVSLHSLKSQNNKAMVQALGLMGQVYGLVGILVGIESAEERELADHFDLAQGFFWSQPVDIEQLGTAAAVNEATAI